MTGLYLHIPFCLRKCPYCDFFSVGGASELMARYIASLTRHLKLWRDSERVVGPFNTVFFGGGTPSLLEPRMVAALLDEAGRLFGLDQAAEITLEANPGTLSLEKLRGYRAAGVNRLSLGVQSFREENLVFLGRPYGLKEIVEGISWARQAGFENLGLDLMFGLQGQTLRSFLGDLRQAIDLSPQHLSLYGLTVEEGTPFAEKEKAGQSLVVADEKWAVMFRRADEVLGRHSFNHYEISNYAETGRECRHNFAYWRRLPCLGVGAGAHSFIPSDFGERWKAPGDLDLFFSLVDKGSNPSFLLETFGSDHAMKETLYLGLRTAQGVCERSFRMRFGVGVREAFPEAVDRLGKNLCLEEGWWRMRVEGWLIYDRLIQEFF